MTQLCTLFQQYKIRYIRLTVTPEKDKGTTPIVIYCLIQGNREDTPGKELILTTGTRLSNSRTYTKRFKAKGRQNDFSYWFDSTKLTTTDARPTIQIGFAYDDYAQLGYGSYNICVVAGVSFRYQNNQIPATLSNTKKKEEDIKEDEKEEDIKDDEKDLNTTEKEIKELEEKLKFLKVRKQWLGERQDKPSDP